MQADCSPLWLSAIKWSRYESQFVKDKDGKVKKSKSGRDRKQITHVDEEGTVVEFMDQFCGLTAAYIPHRFTLAQQRRSREEMERNALLGRWVMDIDWAENFTMDQLNEVNVCFGCGAWSTCD